MNKKVIIIFSTLLILLTACGVGSAMKETRLSTNSADQTNPSLWNNYVVWEDTRNGGNDIYLTDMKTKVQTRITKDVDAQNPFVAGTKIVWDDDRNGNRDIYQYDIKTKKTTRITTNTADQYDPATYDKYIVWIDSRNGYADVYLQDLGTKKQTKITTNTYVSCVGIYGNRVIWSDNSALYAYDLKTKKTTKILDDYIIDSLSIHGNKVIFNDIYDGTFYTSLYDLSSKKYINLPFSYVERPSMYSNKVVWTDYRNGNADIYMAQI